MYHPNENLVKASRPALKQAVAELRRRLTAPAPTPNPRRQAIIETTAKALVLQKLDPREHPEVLDPYWQGPGRLPSKDMLFTVFKPAKALIPFLDLEDATAPWNGGFWRGLRLSGAVYQRWSETYIRPDLAHLVEDLQSWPYAGGLGQRLNLKHSYIHRLQPTDIFSRSVLAGLLYGAFEVDEDGWWLEVPRSPDVMVLLDAWKLSTTQSKDRLRVSAWYGLILNPWMPLAGACRLTSLHHFGDCPLLPIVYHLLCWPTRGEDHWCWPTRSNWPLPASCSDVTRRKHGWNQEFVHRASTKMGLAHVPPRMREVLEFWRFNPPQATRVSQPIL